MKLILGDCLERMGDLEAGSVDAIVCDPPYGLSFMGKNWDHGVPGEAFWREALRVAKPGAHLLAFGGTRTYHRLACAIEDAGWEIRDCIMWVYGSGFPKSLDVSKAIDKAAGVSMESRGHFKFTAADNCVTEGAFRTNEERMNPGCRKSRPATDAAKQWSGWGTALKPSYEPVIWATKPLTVVPRELIIQVESIIGGLICLSLSNAKHAEKILQSSRQGLSEGSASALMIAAVDHGQLNGVLLEKTDMFKSPETGRIILSIVESWKCISDALCGHPSMFTTAMVSEMTTALRIFVLSTSQTMQAFMPPDVCREFGKFMSAPIAGGHLNGQEVNQAHKTSAPDLVTFLMEQKCADSAEKSFTPVALVANTALLSAITFLGENISPSYEPIIVARKPFKGSVASNVLEHGTGGLNIDGCRVEGVVTTNPLVRNVGGFGSNGLANQASPPASVVSQGRWPANLIHDGSEEVVSLFPESKSTANPRHNGEFKSVAKGRDLPHTSYGHSDQGSAARFFYCAKASKADRGEGNTHPTVKPNSLMRYLCRLVTPPGGIVLDPFMGSGSTGKAAIQEGFDFIGIEQDAESFETAKRRISAAEGVELPLFSENHNIEG